MNKSTLALAVAVGVLAQQAGAAGFLEDSKASISSRTMYYNNDNREGGADQKESAEGLKFDYLSGFTQGTVGFGIDAQALLGIHWTAARVTTRTTTPSSQATPMVRPYTNGAVRRPTSRRASRRPKPTWVALWHPTCRSWSRTTAVCCRRPLKAAPSLRKKSTT